MARFGCPQCLRSYKDHRECRRHFREGHPADFEAFGWNRSFCQDPNNRDPPPFLLRPEPEAVQDLTIEDSISAKVYRDMEETSGRGHREKIPSAKIKEQVHKALDKYETTFVASRTNVPIYVASHDPRFELEQKEIPKIHDHTKIGPNGEKTEWYTLGSHVESKDKRYYIRAQRDQDTMYFHAAEAPPYRARLSDENHCQCAIDNLNSVFTKDMMGKSGELGSFTSKANVFAREGQFFYETKVVAQAPGELDASQRHAALANLQIPDHSATNRGSLRVGFCRREAFSGEPLGTSAYSYAALLRPADTREYGCVRFASGLHHVNGKDVDDLKPGDVVGLMITLPSLEVHKKVVHGTFNPADYPGLKCGPAKPKAKGKQVKKKEKSGGKEKEKDSDSGKAKVKGTEDNNPGRTLIRSVLKNETGFDIPIDHDIFRDRNPFIHKNGPCYFECPEYTVRPDLDRPTNVTRQKSINPETGKVYSLIDDPHPQHELPHLRTLPGSKIEIWVNGKYHGILWEHLLAFLPPASHIDTGKSRNDMPTDVDDGLLGYYPAISHYTGGAIECKFDGPWWYGYADGPAHPNARAIGERYKEQIVEDFCADMVDEIYIERTYNDTAWMKNKVVGAGRFNNRE